MPLNYSEKDTEDSASTVQTLGAPFYEMERKSHVLDTERFVCMKKSGAGLPRMARYVSQTVQPFNCCSRNLFTYSCSTVSTTHTLC